MKWKYCTSRPWYEEVQLASSPQIIVAKRSCFKFLWKNCDKLVGRAKLTLFPLKVEYKIFSRAGFILRGFQTSDRGQNLTPLYSWSCWYHLTPLLSLNTLILLWKRGHPWEGDETNACTSLPASKWKVLHISVPLESKLHRVVTIYSRYTKLAANHGPSSRYHTVLLAVVLDMNGAHSTYQLLCLATVFRKEQCSIIL